MKKVSVNLVTWNNLKFLPQCLDSILNQTFNDFSVLIIDNASHDGTIKFLEKHYPQVALLKNARNLGFSKSHNQGVKFAIKKGFEYVLIINPDIILTPDCLRNLVQTMENNEEAASAGPKLLKIQTGNSELGEKIKTGIIDSCGLKILKSRRIVDRGAGEIDKGQYGKEEEVFGISGALVLYRSKALEDVKIDSEYFDEDFFAYKEDVDLAWRFRIRNWKNLYQPKAIAYHYRTAAIKERVKLGEIIKNRKEKSESVNYYSYKNHLLLLVKNEFFLNFFSAFPIVLLYELRKFIYILLFEQKTLKSFWQFLKEFPRILKKRKVIMKNRKIGAKEMSRWFK
ncbi:MAG: Glycosyl transferase, family 2 [Parcubacteria group bacterium Athens1014_10]|nr:MAG: Glycosyl transferase, family 2 [Parcubacteria group bacterium Athens1014_10]TSD04725.1 MAG: Glycosyl transferase, family 2 [Parcubacteria group bacterium Athens0714_12]